MILNIYNEKIEEYILEECKKLELTPEQLVIHAFRIYDAFKAGYLIHAPQNLDKLQENSQPE